MSSRWIAGIIALSLPFFAVAEKPDLNPGMWEYENTTHFESDAIPNQTHTTRECVTAEDLDAGMTFAELPDDCEVRNVERQRTGMSYSMHCDTDAGISVMDADMEFHGDRMVGEIVGDMKTPMGEMKMNLKVEGRRVGDC